MNQRQITFTLAAIGLFDLAYSLWLFRNGVAVEGNPLMASVLSYSPAAFVATKVALLSGPLAVVEWASNRRPRFVFAASRIAAVAYVSVLAVGIYKVGLSERLAAEWERQSAPAIIAPKLPSSIDLIRVRLGTSFAPIAVTEE